MYGFFIETLVWSDFRSCCDKGQILDAKGQSQAVAVAVLYRGDRMMLCLDIRPWRCVVCQESSTVRNQCQGAENQGHSSWRAEERVVIPAILCAVFSDFRLCSFIQRGNSPPVVENSVATKGRGRGTKSVREESRDKTVGGSERQSRRRWKESGDMLWCEHSVLL